MMILIAYLLSCYLLLISVWVYRQPQLGFAWTSSLFGSVFPLYCVLVLGLLSFWEVMQGPPVLRPFFLAMNLFSAALLLRPVVYFLFSPSTFDQDLQSVFPVPEVKRFQPQFLKLFGLQNWSRSSGPQHVVQNRHGHDLKIQIHHAQDPQAPCVFQIHGGGYSRGDFEQLNNYNRFLNKLGYTVVTTSYRFIPDHAWPAQIEDVLDVYNILLERANEFGVNTSRIVLSGRSAGGHLALLAGLRLQDPRIAGIISFYPLIDFEVFYRKGFAGDILDTPNRVMQLLNAKPDENPAIYADINPIRHLHDKAPPIFLVHGDRDSVVSIEHSWIFRQALVANKTPHYLLQLPFDSHGFDVNLNGPGGQKCAFAIRQFLASVLK